MTSLNVLGVSNKPLYLTDPMNKAPDPETSQETEPQNAPESDEITSAENFDKNTQEHDWKKRYSDLKAHYDRQKAGFDASINELKTQISELTSKLVSSKTDSPVMPKTPEEFKVFQEKYPELAAHIITAAMMAVKDTSGVITQKLKELEGVQNAIRSREGINELKKYHPDFEEIKVDPRFHAWFNEQPLKVQELIQSTDPKTIAKGLDMYKVETGISKTPAQKAEAKRDATRDVKTPQRVQIGEGQKRQYTESEIKKMPMSEFEKLLPDITAAQYEGRISKS